MIARLSLLFVASLTVACGGSSGDPPAQPDADVPPPGSDAGTDAGTDAPPPSDLCTALQDIVLDSEAKVAAIAGCTSILGSLVVTGSSPAVIDLPELREIAGDLLVFEAPALTSFSAARLDHVSGDVSFVHDAALAALHVDGLHEVGGTFKLAGLPLAELRFDHLGRVKSLEIDGTPAQVISFASLDQVHDDVRIVDAAAATQVSFAHLDFVGGKLELKNVGAAVGAATPRIDLSLLDHAAALTLDGVRVHELLLDKLHTISGELGFVGSDLEIVHIGLLERIGQSLRIAHNRRFPDLILGNLVSAGNLRIGSPIDTTGSCPAGSADEGSYALALPGLTSAQDVHVCGEHGLAFLALDNLTLMPLDLQIVRADSLSRLSLQKLAKVFGRVRIVDNAQLLRFEEAISTIGTVAPAGAPALELHGNPSLECRAAALAAAVAADRTADVRDNGSACSL